MRQLFTQRTLVRAQTIKISNSQIVHIPDLKSNIRSKNQIQSDSDNELPITNASSRRKIIELVQNNDLNNPESSFSNSQIDFISREMREIELKTLQTARQSLKILLFEEESSLKKLLEKVDGLDENLGVIDRQIRHLVKRNVKQKVELVEVIASYLLLSKFDCLE